MKTEEDKGRGRVILMDVITTSCVNIYFDFK
jgi:hypothetical protein